LLPMCRRSGSAGSLPEKNAATECAKKFATW
jgi:hypothetical protein